MKPTLALNWKQNSLKQKLNMVRNLLIVICSMVIPSFAHAQISGDTVKIGFLTDMSGAYADVDGSGGAEAIKMAIADFGGVINGKKIEFVAADHQNKADIAASKMREWFDRDAVDMVIGGTNSSASLAMAKIAKEKGKLFIAIGAGSSRLTNEDCAPTTIHYAYDTIALSRGTGEAIVKQGGKSWFFLTADYAFGASLEKDTSDIVKANGGTVVGAVKHPFPASDFSSFVVQAQASKAQILGLANAGADTINAIKAANEYGVTQTMKLAGLLMFINDVHSLGLEMTQNMYLTTAWYWDLNPTTRAWSKRFFDKMKREPSMLQAADYSAAWQYLNAVKTTGTDNELNVLKYLKANKINDMFTQNGVIRGDGLMLHDMYLMQVKKPAESKYPWDYYKVVQTIAGEKAYNTKAESKCVTWQ